MPNTLPPQIADLGKGFISQQIQFSLNLVSPSESSLKIPPIKYVIDHFCLIL